MPNIKYELNETVLPYVLDKLKSGHGFSQAFLQRKLYDNIHFYTYLDRDVDSENLYSIEDGIKGLIYEVIEESFYDEVEQYLKTEGNIAIFEDAYMLRSGNHCYIYPNKFFIDDNIYYFITHEDNSREKIENILRASSSAWQQLFFFTSLSKEMKIENNSDLSQDQISKLTDKVVKVFVDAYDLDSFIVCDLTSSK